MPNTEATKVAILRVQAWLLAASPPVVWLEFSDPAITFACYEEEDAENVRIRLDVEPGASLVTVEPNIGVELQWVTRSTDR